MTSDREEFAADVERMLNARMSERFGASPYRAVVTVNSVDSSINEYHPAVIVKVEDLANYLAMHPPYGMLDYVVLPVSL